MSTSTTGVPPNRLVSDDDQAQLSRLVVALVERPPCIQAGKILHVRSPLPKGGAEFIGVWGRATDHYPMLKNSTHAVFEAVNG
jgi:hypothetical protein